MKLVTFESQGAEWLGALTPDETGIVDFAADDSDPVFGSMLALIEAGDDALARGRELADAAKTTVAVSEVKLLSPIPVPPQIRDFLSFEQHLQNGYRMLRDIKASMEPDPKAALEYYEEHKMFAIPDVWYEQPIYYKPNRFNVVGTGADVICPDYAQKVDYEMEFGCWIGNPGVNVTPAQAKDMIFGYSVFNDISLRDVQAIEYPAGLGPGKGKDFDTGKILGPCIVTADSFDPMNAEMIVRLNGEEVSRGQAGDIHWKLEDCIAHAAKYETLHPGEFIASGTVGWGSGMEQQHFLENGDVIALEVTGIGVISNRIVRTT